MLPPIEWAAFCSVLLLSVCAGYIEIVLGSKATPSAYPVMWKLLLLPDDAVVWVEEKLLAN